MTNKEFTIRATEQAEKNFEKIKASIKGLYEILNINFADNDDEFYLEAGEDNLMGLYQNFIELLTNEYGLRQLVKKVNRSEINLDIVLNELEEEITEE